MLGEKEAEKSISKVEGELLGKLRRSADRSRQLSGRRPSKTTHKPPESSSDRNGKKGKVHHHGKPNVGKQRGEKVVVATTTVKKQNETVVF